MEVGSFSVAKLRVGFGIEAAARALPPRFKGLPKRFLCEAVGRDRTASPSRLVRMGTATTPLVKASSRWYANSDYRQRLPIQVADAVVRRRSPKPFPGHRLRYLL